MPQHIGYPIFSVDAETDDLFGPVWAIGAVVLGEVGKVIDKFDGQVNPSDVKSEWVQKNSVPFVNLPRYSDRRALRDAFWAFWMKWRECTMPIADCLAPVEVGLFRACVEDDLPEREWKHPYPLHDLGTLLAYFDFDPQNCDRRQFVEEKERAGLNLHNHVDDAFASGKCWLKFWKHRLSAKECAKFSFRKPPRENRRLLIFSLLL